MAGRPTKLTPERQAKIVEALRAGNYFETACASAGISPALGYEWLARGEGRDPDRKCTPLHAEFADAVRLAEAQAEAEAVGVVRAGFDDNPRLALDFLARRCPARWAPTQRHEVTGKDGEDVRLSVTLEVLQRARLELEAWQREREAAPVGRNGTPG
jgi:hypothetical protein